MSPTQQMNQSINTDSKNSKEPQQKHRPGTASIKILGGSNQVLQAPNFALSFYHGSKHTVVRSAWRFGPYKVKTFKISFGTKSLITLKLGIQHRVLKY